MSCGSSDGAEHCQAFDRKSHTRDWPRLPQSGHSPSPGSRSRSERSARLQECQPIPGLLARDRNSRVARDCVVELVGLEPTTRVLWNAGVSDQLTLSDTKHSSSKRPAIDGHFYKREIFGWKSPVFPARPSF